MMLSFTSGPVFVSYKFRTKPPRVTGCQYVLCNIFVPTVGGYFLFEKTLKIVAVVQFIDSVSLQKQGMFDLLLTDYFCCGNNGHVSN